MAFVLLVLNVSYISLIVSKVPGILMVDVVKELEALRQNLLDLSLRNNLLNYRPSQKRTISITGRKPEEIYALFVFQEKSMRFRATAQLKKGRKAENEVEDEASEKEKRLFLSRKINLRLPAPKLFWKPRMIAKFLIKSFFMFLTRQTPYLKNRDILCSILRWAFCSGVTADRL